MSRQASSILAQSLAPRASVAFLRLAGLATARPSHRLHLPVLRSQSQSAFLQQRTFVTLAASSHTPLLDEKAKTQLRPYQEDCIQACLTKLNKGKTRIGVSLPTGSGKVSFTVHVCLISATRLISLPQTVIFADLFPRLPARMNDDGSLGERVLIIVSTVGLAEQTARAVRSMHPNLVVEIVQGAQAATGQADVTIATRQTLDRSRARLEKFDPAGLKCGIVDEAHHAVSKSYRRILRYFNSSVKLPREEVEVEISEDGTDMPPTAVQSDLSQEQAAYSECHEQVD